MEMIKGFKASAVSAGIKGKAVRKDLGLIVSDVPANAAAVFTQNKIQAAPILLCQQRIKYGTCRALIVNSGNANCCTGKQGIQDAEETARLAANALGIPENMVLVASTGVIGKPMPMKKIQEAVAGLASSLSCNGISDVADSIMTTDTRRKLVSVQGSIDGVSYNVTGMAKGSGMIKPDMATLLCFVCTDVGASPEILKQALSSACNRSFNRITVDGDTSTNDMALVMANGMSGAWIKTSSHVHSFQTIMDDVLMNLARMIVKDGEGATKLVEIIVKGAVSDSDADRVANTIAHSPLVKTAIFGQDANWGRILAATGRAGVPIEPEKIDLFFDDVMMVKGGTGCGEAAESNVTSVMKKPEFSITVDLNIGTGKAQMLTCDFSVDYVKINADYRT